MNNGHDADREVVAKILGLEGREIDRVGIAAEQWTWIARLDPLENAIDAGAPAVGARR
jgi:hypothetical protein